MSTANTTQESGGAPKHRACDECRTRKLACSKESEGCSRCRREGIQCHYSVQKPMGRPRKRPREAANETAPTEVANKTPMLEMHPEIEDPGLAFLDFLTTGEFDLDLDFNHRTPENPLQNGDDWNFGAYLGNDLGQLNLGTSTADHAPSFASSNLDPSLFSGSHTPSKAPPTLSSGASSTTADSASPPSPSTTSCACLASLYVAMDSMQRLPADMTEALRQTRLATRTAYNVVNCQVCGMSSPDLVVHTHPANEKVLRNFQVLMLLATLIPSIVHGYERMLVAVDEEAAKAQAERRDLPFQLQNYGGVWGAFAEHGLCASSTSTLDHMMMEPATWRLTIRSLLRVDVYGLSCERTEGERGGRSPDFLQLGLWDIVTQMENQSKARHAILDPLIMSGALEDPKCVFTMHKPGETPTCQNIIRIARSALDNLVIA